MIKLTKHEVMAIAGGQDNDGGCYGIDENNNYFRLGQLGSDTIKNICRDLACRIQSRGWFYNGTDREFLGFDEVTGMAKMGPASETGACLNFIVHPTVGTTASPTASPTEDSMVSFEVPAVF
jgi:hypothetical protein